MERQKVGRGSMAVVRGSGGRTLLTATAAMVFGLALFWLCVNLYSIADADMQNTLEPIIPVFEPGDEVPANRADDDAPTPVLLPASTETLPEESMDMAADPQASEAVEFVLQKPFAEAAGRPADPVVTAAKSPRFGSLTTESTPAISREDPAQPPEDPYVDETLLRVPTQSTPSDMPTSTEETSAQAPQPPPDLGTNTGTCPQPLPPDLPVDAGTPHQSPATPDETTLSSSDLPADSSLITEDTAYIE